MRSEDREAAKIVYFTRIQKPGFRYLFVALVMGLGWAVRGHFGHEYGAAWAGALGVLAILAVAGRKDWSLKMPVLVVLGGVGWAVGGMMSYGLIVGAGRGTDFFNVYYGFSMLAVVGGLYGFIGGGLLGLGLESTEEHKPNWLVLLAEMVAGAVLVWNVVIVRLGWKMTPPRSEAWAVVLGASLALTWYLYRHGYRQALRLAGYSALGGGLGFAFGNFLQVMGNVTGLSFNWWNLMEFTFGFFGGLGMAYGVYTGEWPESIRLSKVSGWLALIFLIFVIPAITITQAMEIGGFEQLAERLGLTSPAAFAHRQLWLVWSLLLVFSLAGIITRYRYRNNDAFLVKSYLPFFLFGYSAFYIILGHFKKGFFYGYGRQPEQYFYWLVLAAAFLVWFMQRRKEPAALLVAGKPESWKRWVFAVLALLGIMAILTGIAINSHQDLPGAYERF